jgi:hypothetical protein
MFYKVWDFGAINFLHIPTQTIVFVIINRFFEVEAF